MTVFQAVVLGLLQGLAEFLPISSSAHLSLAPWMFGWPDPGLSFDVALHVGTLAAVLWYFRTEWVALAHSALDLLRRRRADTDETRRVLHLLVASIPAGLAGVILQDSAERLFHAPGLTAAALMVMGVVLWAADRFASRDRYLGQMRYRDALLIGLAQMFALVPGVSRSGATMTASRALRFDRRSAAVFSFLLSMPITAAAAVVKVPEAVRDSGLSPPLLAGVAAAAASSWVAIAVLLRYLSHHSFGVFAVYRIVLGIVVLSVLAVRG